MIDFSYVNPSTMFPEQGYEVTVDQDFLDEQVRLEAVALFA